MSTNPYEGLGDKLLSNQLNQANPVKGLGDKVFDNTPKRRNLRVENLQKDALLFAADTDPDQHALDIQRGAQLKKPTALIAAAPEVAKKLVEREKIQQYQRSNQPVIEWASKPENAPLVHDDMDALTYFENTLKSMVNAATSVTDSYQYATDAVRSIPAEPLTLMGEELQSMGQDLRNVASTGPDMSTIPKALVSSAAYVLSPLGYPIEGAGLILDTVGEALEVPDERKGFNTTAGGTVGQVFATIFAAPIMLPVFFGSSYRQEKSKAIDNGATENEADAVGFLSGIAEVGSEYLGTNKIMKMMPKNMSSRLIKDAIEVIGASGIEVLEELAADYAKQLAHMGVYDPNAEFDISGGMSFVDASGMFTGIAAMSVVGKRKSAVDQKEAQTREVESLQEGLTRLREAAETSRTFGRNKEAFVDFVESVNPDKEDPNVYIDAESVNTFFQSNNQEASEIFEQMGLGLAFAEAVQEGGDVRVPLSQLISLKDTQNFGSLLDDVRYNIGDNTARELREQSDPAESDLVAEADRLFKEGVVTDETASVAEGAAKQLKDMLVTTGRFEADTAEQYASLHKAFITTFVGRGFATNEQMKKYYNLEVVDQAGVLPEGVTLSQNMARIPEVQEAAQAFARGEITRNQMAEIVEQFNPVTAYESVPAVATSDEMLGALKPQQMEKVGLASTIVQDHPVGLRLDIPAYTTHGVWVPTIHERFPGKGGKKVIAHESAAVINNVTFPNTGNKALNVAKGNAKSPFAVIEGTWDTTDTAQAEVEAQEALNSPDWVQVGFDPTRHSYFYDRANSNQVVSADRVIQVGPLVLAQNPVYGEIDPNQTIGQDEVFFQDPESETFQAVAKGLDMSEPSRHERAQGMGFDTANVKWHASPNTFDEFDLNAARLNRSTNVEGVYFSPTETTEYGEAKPYFIRVSNTAVGDVKPSQAMLDEYEKQLIENGVYRNEDWVREAVVPEYAQTWRMKSDISGTIKRKVLEAGGYDSYQDGGDVVVFDPKNIRSTNAAFDPDFANSSNILQQTVYHGSPYRFSKFDHSKMGTGEGAQAYGWGTYIAENKDVANQYRINLAYDPSEMKIGGKQINEYYDDLSRVADRSKDNAVAQDGYEKAGLIERLMSNETPQEVESWANGLGHGDWFRKEIKPNFQSFGFDYEVDLPDEKIAQMLDWDKPLSEQPESVRNALKPYLTGGGSPDPDLQRRINVMESKIAINPSLEEGYRTRINKLKGEQSPSTSITGQQVISDLFPDQKTASKKLSEAGIPGIKYLDDNSRSEGEGTRNFVVFDENDLTVLTVNGEKVQNTTFYQTAPDNKHGVPRYFITRTEGEVSGKSKLPKVLHDKNVEKQSELLDELAVNHPDPLNSVDDWYALEREILGDNETPAAPLDALDMASDVSVWADRHSKLTPEQLAAASQGFEIVEEFSELYASGGAAPLITGKLMLWGMLSRRMSTHPHESAFLDAVNSGQLEEIVNSALEREWTDADLSKYAEWAGSIIPDFAPGKQGTSNMNDFGKDFLRKMSKRMPDGRSALEHLHDMIADRDISSAEVRRRFYGLAGSVGIKNKVLSFVLLLSGRTDVMVMDRIQINTMWDAGQYGKLIYDDVVGLFEDAHGLARYEALERSLLLRVDELYAALGRPEDASVSRYHWESWVLNSGQVVAHPTIQGLVDFANGEADPFYDIGAPEGRFHQFAFGSIYARDSDNQPYISYNNSKGESFRFGLEDFKKMLTEVRKPAQGVIPKGFSVKTFREIGYPWYEAEEVNREKLDQLIAEFSGGRESPLRAVGASSNPNVPGQEETQAEGLTLNQEKDAPKGSITFPAAGVGENTTYIKLMQGADLSTFLHESGHLFLEIAKDLAAQPGAKPQLVAMMKTLTDWFGTTEIGTEQHEKFARGFEAYLREGKAPSVELQSVFDRFMGWLLDIYKELRQLNVTLNNDVREVMDRMLATEDAINEVEEVAGFGLMFESAEEAGVSEEEFLDMKIAAERAHSESLAEVRQKQMAELEKEKSQSQKAERKKLTEEITAKYEAKNVYRIRHLLMYGTLPGGQVPIGLEGVKLSKQWLIENMGDEKDATWKKLPKGKFAMVSTQGMDVAQLASMFGYASGVEMINELVSAPKLKDIVNPQVRKIMSERYQSLTHKDNLTQEAMKVVADKQRKRGIYAELRVLARRASVKPITQQALREIARSRVAALKVRDLQPNKHLQAMRKHSQEATRAMLAGDHGNAYKHKAQQLLNLHLYSVTLKIRDQVAKDRKYLTKFAKPSVRKKLARDYLDQIDSILEAVSLKQNVSGKELDRRKAFSEWYDEQMAAHGSVEMPKKYLEKLRTNFKDMPVQELITLVDSLRNIEHLAKLKQQILVGKELRDYNETMDQAYATALEVNPEIYDPDAYNKRSRYEDSTTLMDPTLVSKLRAEHIKMEFLAEQMDGDVKGGLWWNLLFKPIADAENTELAMIQELGTQLGDILNSETFQNLQRELSFTSGDHWNKNMLVSVALNWGNSGNRTSLTEGLARKGVDAVDIERFLNDNMTKNDWDTIQQVWDLIDSYWPAIAALQKKLTGVVPEKVERSPVETPFGTYPGGYYPLIFDPKKSSKVQERTSKTDVMENLSDNFIKPTTRKGHAIERVGSGGLPVKLDITVMTNHLAQVIHDIAFREAIIQTDRVIQDQRTVDAIKRVAGEYVYEDMRPWLGNVAGSGQLATDAGSKLFNALRKNTTIVNMAYKLSTAIVQPLGMTQSIEILGLGWAMTGIQEFYGNPAQVFKKAEEVMQKSIFMRNRKTSFDRDVNDAMRMLTHGTSVLEQIQKWGFEHIGFMDLTISMPTWLGAYRKALSENKSESDAVSEADSVVRMTQGNGTAKDLAMIQQGDGRKKSATLFYSAFSAMYNLMRRRRNISRREEEITVKKVAINLQSLIYMVVMPAVLGEIIAGRFPDEDEDEDYTSWMAKLIIAYPFMTVVLVRDIASALSSKYDYQMTPIAGAVTDILNATEAVAGLTTDPADALVSESFYKTMVMGAGYYFGLPSRQAWILQNNTMDLINGESLTFFEFIMLKERRD